MAAVDYFLKLEGIEGESQDDKHKNEIHIESFSHGVTNAGTGGINLGSGAGRSNVQDFQFTKRTDKSSPNLFIACCSGKHIPTATITIRKAGENPVEYLVWKLTEVFVSSYQTGGHGGGDVAQESFSLNFSKIEYKYSPQNADGTLGGAITKTYDVKGNKVS